MIRDRGRGKWTVSEGYSPSVAKGPRNFLLWLLCPVFAGLIGGMLLEWRGSENVAEAPISAIEWNVVQAVPKRTPDLQDTEWERRATDVSLLASPGAEQQVRPEFADRRDKDAQSTAGPIHVIDGDTFSLGAERVRIANIDAPEIHPPHCPDEARLGLAATQRLRELLSGGAVTMSGSARDRYGRALRYVQVNGADVGEALIGAGLARSYDGKKRLGWC